MTQTISGSLLILDDDPALVSVMKEILEEEGYRVETSTDAVEALRLVDESHPSAILMDMRMPGMDGWAFAGSLKERGSTASIIVITGGDHAFEWAKEVSADDFLAKPFDMAELLATVRRYCAPASAKAH